MLERLCYFSINKIGTRYPKTKKAELMLGPKNKEANKSITKFGRCGIFFNVYLKYF